MKLIVLGLVLSVLAAFAQAQTPVLYFNCNEKTGSIVTDRSNNGNNGALTTSASWFTFTPDGSTAAVSVGSSNSIKVNPSQSLNFSGSQLTMEAAVFSTSMNNESTVIDRLIQTGPDRGGYRLTFDEDGYASATILTANGLFTVSATDLFCTIPQFAWTHLAAVYDGSSLDLYANGSLVGSVSATGALLQPANSELRFGARTVASTSPLALVGAIDEIKIFSQALTPAQVLSQAESALSQTTRLVAFDFDGFGLPDHVSLSGIKARLSLYIPFESTPYKTFDVELEEVWSGNQRYGVVDVNVPAAPGIFDVLGKPSHWLGRVALEAPSICNNLSVTFHLLYNGDVNNDNKVDDFDLFNMTNDFLLFPSGVNGETDLNGDFFVDDFDLFILTNNFLKVGDML